MTEKRWRDQCREKRRFWQVHIQAWKRSGLIQAEYCRQHDLRVNRFVYWKKKIAANSPQTSLKESSFVPVPVITSPVVRSLDNHLPDSGVKIHLGDLTITLTVNFNPDVLARAVSTLGGKP